MIETTVTITRPQSNGSAPSTIAQHVAVQVDQMSDAATWQHNRAFNSTYRLLYSVTTIWWNPTSLILQGDVLQDEQFTDPDTGAGYLYRIEATPKNYVYSHQQMKATIAQGTE